MERMNMDLAQPEDRLKDILTLDLQTCDVSVCMASGGPNDPAYSFRLVNQSPRLEQKFRDAIKEALDGYRKQLDEGELTLNDFTAEKVQPDEEIEYLNLLPYDSIKRQIEPVEHYVGLSYFRHDEHEFIKKMRFYVLRVQPPQGPAICFYRHYSPSQMLSHSQFFAMIFMSNLYDDLTEPTFLFDRHIDCFSSEEYMFILKKHNFFQIFDIGELEKVAREILDKLEKKGLIHNFQQFKRDCIGNKIKILKLKNISTRPYLDRLTIEDLEKTISRYSLPIAIDLVGGRKKMHYDPSRDRWAILHLLDDAYADSPMTKSSYYLKGKREIRRK